MKAEWENKLKEINPQLKYKPRPKVEWAEYLTDEEMKAPFNPKMEISQDARYIVKTLWKIFVILPFILGAVIGAIQYLMK